MYDFPQKNFSMCHGTFSPIPDPSKNWSVNIHSVGFIRSAKVATLRSKNQFSLGLFIPTLALPINCDIVFEHCIKFYLLNLIFASGSQEGLKIQKY